jgi:hypothetical protein
MIDVPSLREARLKELYRRYLSDRGIRSKPIPEKSSKTPDFWLEHGDRRILSELKAPELRIDTKHGLYKWKTTLQKLQARFRTAVKQFSSEDPTHEHPRLLVLMSCHFQLNLFSLRDAIQGGVLNPDGTWLTDLRATDAYSRWLESIGQIDAILWLQLSVEREELYQAGYFVQQGSVHLEAVDRLFNVLKVQPLGDHDQLIAMTHGVN